MPLKALTFRATAPAQSQFGMWLKSVPASTLAPSGDARQTLAEDYQRMVEDGLLSDDAEPFDVLLQRCQALALKVNAAVLGAA